MNFKLTKREIEEAEEQFQGIRSLIDELERVRQFKVGDYLIAKEFDTHSGEVGNILMSISYKTPEKFVVVYVSSDKVPFYKRLDVNGTPIGRLFCCMHSELESPTRDVKWKGSPYYMELDPDYADAIILDSKDDFRASDQKKRKANLYKEITNHNKSSKINTDDDNEFEKFLRTIKVGDVLWRSARTSFTVNSIEKMTRAEAERRYGQKINSSSYFPGAYKLTILITVDGKGNEHIISSAIWRIQCSNMYKQRPRSYRELRD